MAVIPQAIRPNMPCFSIQYRDRYGSHTGFIWGDSPEAALRSFRGRHKGKRSRGAVDYDTPALVDPQPFTEASRAQNAARYAQEQKALLETKPEVEIHFDAPEENLELTDEHEREEEEI
jgi:hypothetical protein